MHCGFPPQLDGVRPDTGFGCCRAVFIGPLSLSILRFGPGEIPLSTQLRPTLSGTDDAGGVLRGLLVPERVAVDIHVSSKKRLMEEIATLLTRGNPSLNKDTVFQLLVEREHLGSTGIGNGIAIPHARLNGLGSPTAAVLRLTKPLPFDAIDGEPVSLVLALIVPADATQDHLKILAALAQLSNDSSRRSEFYAAQGREALFNMLG